MDSSGRKIGACLMKSPRSRAWFTFCSCLVVAEEVIAAAAGGGAQLLQEVVAPEGRASLVLAGSSP